MPQFLSANNKIARRGHAINIIIAVNQHFFPELFREQHTRGGMLDIWNLIGVAQIGQPGIEEFLLFGRRYNTAAAEQALNQRQRTAHLVQ